VRVLVLPADRRREAVVVDRVRHRGAGERALLALLDVERPPFGPLVDPLVGQDEAAFFANELASLVVERTVARKALGGSSHVVGDVLDHAEPPHAPSDSAAGNACLLFNESGIYLYRHRRRSPSKRSNFGPS